MSDVVPRLLEYAAATYPVADVTCREAADEITDLRLKVAFRDNEIARVAGTATDLRRALKYLLAEVEYAIQVEEIPATWLDPEQADIAIVNAREALLR